MSPIEDFDAQLFADELRSLYFQRTRQEAAEKEDVLLGQVQGIIKSATVDREAYERLTGAPGWIRLEKLLHSAQTVGGLAELLDRAADRIESLENPPALRQVSPDVIQTI